MKKNSKLNQKNNSMPDVYEVSIGKIFNAANLIPVEYKHSAKFYQDGLDPLEYERHRLANIPTDWLMQDKRIPAIKADSLLELEQGKKQYINHLFSIQSIIDLQRAEILRAQDLITRLDEEIAGYDSEIERLRALVKK